MFLPERLHHIKENEFGPLCAGMCQPDQESKFQRIVERYEAKEHPCELIYDGKYAEYGPVSQPLFVRIIGVGIVLQGVKGHEHWVDHAQDVRY